MSADESSSDRSNDTTNETSNDTTSASTPPSSTSGGAEVTAPATRQGRGSGGGRVAGIVTVVAGIILALAGVVTWFTVQNNLADEKITVSSDSPRWAGDPVDGPFTAFQEADNIKRHYLSATGGKTYAELDKDDPARQTAMTASFLRASLFTSVVAFGVAAMAVGLGIAFVVVGWGLLALARRPVVVSTT